MNLELSPHHHHQSNTADLRKISDTIQKYPKVSINSFGGIPDQVLVDVSHADRMGGDGPSAISFLVITVIFAVVTSILTIYRIIPPVWDSYVFPWTSVAILSLGIWADSYETKHKFRCNYCANRRCTDRGVDRKVFFCNKWAAPFVPHFLLLLIAAYGIFTTFLLFFSNQFWIMIFSMFLSAIFLGMTTLGVIAELFVKSKRDFRVFVHPPNHSPYCICGGTGICSMCHGTGKLKVARQTFPCPIVCSEEPGVEEKGVEGAGCILCAAIIIIFGIYLGIWTSGVLF